MKKILTSNPKVLWKLKCTLGEGTLWVKEHNSIYFVDIKKKKFFSLNIKNNKKKIYKVNKEIGFLAHIKNNIFILGLQGELRIQNIMSKKIIESMEVIKSEPNVENIVDLIGDSLEENSNLKKTAYILAIEIMMADLEVSEESYRLLELLENSFELDALETTSIKHTIKFKYQDI